MKSNIEILLGEWGAWKRGENRSSLGYPDQSAFQRMRVDGQRRADPYALMVDDDLRKLDGHIAHLFPEARTIVVAHYVWVGPVKAKLERAQVARTRCYDLLDMAHKQLSHWMGGSYVLQPCKAEQTILSGHLA